MDETMIEGEEDLNRESTMDEDQRVLVVDDEEGLRAVLSQVLSEDGFHVTVAECGEEAWDLFEKEPFPLVITDIVMPGMRGIDLLEKIKGARSDTQVIVMTSNASLDTAVSAVRSGAYDYLFKPFDEIDVILQVANRAMEKVHFISGKQKMIQSLRKKSEELEQANKSLRRLAIRDGLTGVFNHRYFHEELSKELLRAERNNSSCSLVFIDVDFFKQYNDKYGHIEGDEVLRAVSILMKRRFRRTDLIARYGGDEFVVILPETDKETALTIAEDLNRVLQDLSFPDGDNVPKTRVTLSVGIATFPEDGVDEGALIQRADQGLYLAKKNGRNRVCIACDYEADLLSTPEEDRMTP